LAETEGLVRIEDEGMGNLVASEVVVVTVEVGLVITGETFKMEDGDTVIRGAVWETLVVVVEMEGGVNDFEVVIPSVFAVMLEVVILGMDGFVAMLGVAWVEGA